MGEMKRSALRVDFDRSLTAEFHGSKVTSDAVRSVSGLARTAPKGVSDCCYWTAEDSARGVDDKIDLDNVSCCSYYGIKLACELDSGQSNGAVSVVIVIACPACGKHLIIPERYVGQQGACVGCKHLIDVPNVESESEGRNYTVADPSRARRTFKRESFVSASKSIIKASYWFAGLVLLVRMTLWWGVDQQPVRGPGATLENLKNDALLYASVLAQLLCIGVVLWYLGVAGYRILTAFRPPRSNNPIRTLEAFSLAIDNELYARAYNCLTDGAQKVSRINKDKDDYLQLAMPPIEFEDAKSFRHFYSNFGFRFVFETRSLEDFTWDKVADDCVTLSLQATAYWEASELDEAHRGNEESLDRAEGFPVSFTLVRRGEIWFLTRGYFLPKGAQFMGKPSQQPKAWVSNNAN